MADLHDRLLRKLDSIASLSPEDRAAVARLPFQVRSTSADSTVVAEGDHPSECCLVLDGLLCSYNLLPEGARQITSFFLAGDIPDLQSLQLHTLDHSIATLTPSRLAFISHAALSAMLRERPDLVNVFWRESLITGCLHRQWVVNTGRRSAYARIAHLMCEMYVRFRVVGLAGEGGFDLPITQAEMGDAAGLSTVHVNRVLQELRADQLIVSEGRFIRIPDWKRLKQAGQFDPTYLHLTGEARQLLA